MMTGKKEADINISRIIDMREQDKLDPEETTELINVEINTAIDRDVNSPEEGI